MFQNSHVHKAIAYMLASTIGSSAMMVIVKWSAMNYPMVVVIFFRSLFALLFYILIAFIKKFSGTNIYYTKNIKMHFIHSFLGIIAMFFYFYSFTFLPLAEATAISFTTPLFVTIFSYPILKERVSPYCWLPIFIGFGGVLFVIQPASSVFCLTSLIGVFAAFFCSLALLCLRYLGGHENTVTTSLYYSLFTTLALIPLVPFKWVTPTLYDFSLLCLLGVGGGVEQLFATQAFKYGPAALMSPLSYTAIIWATVFGYIFWKEVPQFYTLIGTSIIIVSTWYIINLKSEERVEQW